MCHICQKKFSRKCYLKQHVQRHEGVKPYVCDECPKRSCTAFKTELKRCTKTESLWNRYDISRKSPEAPVRRSPKVVS